MPVKHPCTKCRKACKGKVREGEESICCDKCNNWVHFRCTVLTNDELNHLISTDDTFTCDRCLKTCLNCKRYCRINQKTHVCKICMQQIHEKCLTDEYGRFLNDSDSGSLNFFCCNCSQIPADFTPAIPNTTITHNSDFQFENPETGHHPSPNEDIEIQNLYLPADM